MHHAHTTSLPSLIATKKMNEIWFLKFSGRRSWVLAFGVLVFGTIDSSIYFEFIVSLFTQIRCKASLEPFFI